MAWIEVRTWESALPRVCVPLIRARVHSCNKFIPPLEVLPPPDSLTKEGTGGWR